MVYEILPSHHVVMGNLSIESSKGLHPEADMIIKKHIMKEGLTEEGRVIMLRDLVLICFEDVLLGVCFGEGLHNL
jgi:hypothetical protein